MGGRGAASGAGAGTGSGHKREISGKANAPKDDGRQQKIAEKTKDDMNNTEKPRYHYDSREEAKKIKEQDARNLQKQQDAARDEKKKFEERSKNTDRVSEKEFLSKFKSIGANPESAELQVIEKDGLSYHSKYKKGSNLSHITVYRGTERVEKIKIEK